MSFSEILFSFFIRPIELILDVVFYRVFLIVENVGVTIIFLSIIVNLLVLPLYNRADKIQAEESKKKKKIKKWEDHIKANFKGNERFMMLQTYYRQCNYKPYQSLKSAMPLLLEIPFFIAAFHFLSNLTVLNGTSFWVLKNLGAPDKLLKIGGLSINVLPILMTVINIISATIYNRTEGFKDKLKTYAMALVFLVLLYNSPSGLTFYWTLNNVFSLIKNIVYRFIPEKEEKKKPFAKDSAFGFISSAALLAVLTGLYIPTTIVKSSVQEFIDIVRLENPVSYIIICFITAVGFFVLWLGIFYCLTNERFRSIFSKITCSLAIIGLLLYIATPDDFDIGNNLLFYSVPAYSTSLDIQGIVIFAAVVLVCFFIYNKKKNFIISILFSGVAVFLALGVSNLVYINKEFKEKSANLVKYNETPEIHLSKNGKNVIVIMMDRMVSYYIPYIFNEKPELAQYYDGFTYYPTSVSYGTATNSGSPGLYGGYDYIPERMNERDNMKLVDKQNEALKVMPVLFYNEGYDVTVCDPTYAGYEWVPDLSIYDDYPGMHKYITKGRMSPEEYRGDMAGVLKRNLFFYSIFRISPTIVRNKVYDNGNYNSATNAFKMEVGYQTIYSNTMAKGLSEEFFDSYCVLSGLANITQVDDTDNGSFMMISNDTTHSDTLLSEPDYTPMLYVDNTEYAATHKERQDWQGNVLNLYEGGNQIQRVDGSVLDGNTAKVLHYHINAVSLQMLGYYFEYLKQQGVYDNTRIIIVSDHSAPLSLDKDLMCLLTFEDGSETVDDLLSFQSTLLVKDFDSTGFKMDVQFMTNADVPSIATDGIIENAKNPFTGNELKSNQKNEAPVKVMATDNFKIEGNHGNRFVPAHWFSVHDNIFDGANWAYEGYY